MCPPTIPAQSWNVERSSQTGRLGLRVGPLVSSASIAQQATEYRGSTIASPGRLDYRGVSSTDVRNTKEVPNESIWQHPPEARFEKGRGRSACRPAGADDSTACRDA